MRSYLLTNENFRRTDKYTPGCWVNVECPDNEDAAFLTEGLGVPADFIEYVSDVDERPRVDVDMMWVLTILRIPQKVRDADGDEQVLTVPIGIISNGDITVTICYYKTELIDDFIKHNRNRRITVKSQSTFVLRLIFSATFWFLEYLKDISWSVTHVEHNLETSIRNDDLARLMNLQKTLVYFNTSLKGNEVLIGRLRHVFTDDFDLDLLEDVEIELKQALNTVNVYTEILSNALATYASVISNNLNAVMKRMTGATIVLMIPTLIASFYGMNVVIGLGDNPYGFWIIAAVALLLTILTFLLLRHIKWF